MNVYTNDYGVFFDDYIAKDLALREFTEEVIGIIRSQNLVQSELGVEWISDKVRVEPGMGCFSLSSYRLPSLDGELVLRPLTVCVPNNLLVEERWRNPRAELFKSFQRFSKEPISYLSTTTWSLLHELGHAMDNERGIVLEGASPYIKYQNTFGVENSYFDLEVELSATRNAVYIAQNPIVRKELMLLENNFPAIGETDAQFFIPNDEDCPRLSEDKLVA